MTATETPAQRPPRRISGRGLAVFVVAVIAVVAATVVGVRGLLGSPIESTNRDGTATIHGTWEPYACATGPCEGYVQAGGRSVFVVLPAHCPRPPRAVEVTVTGRLDTSLGSGSYRATGCAATG